jgi:hypothetical protein
MALQSQLFASPNKIIKRRDPEIQMSRLIVVVYSKVIDLKMWVAIITSDVVLLKKRHRGNPESPVKK